MGGGGAQNFRVSIGQGVSHNEGSPKSGVWGSVLLTNFFLFSLN